MASSPISGEIVATPLESTHLSVYDDGSQLSENKRDTDRPWLWKKGESGNPGGRPKTRHITERLREQLANGDATVIADILLESAKSKQDKWLQLAVAKEIADRTEGKAQAQLNVQHSIDEGTLKRLNELAERFL